MSKIIHGGDVYSHPGVIDFSSNMNPFGTPESVIRAAAEALTSISSYPDPLCRELVTAIADSEGSAPSQIICGNGAAELLFTYAAALKPRRALLPAPAFAEYEQAMMSVNCHIDFYHLRVEDGFNFRQDLTDRLDPDLDLVVLCNPNNPTGLLIDPDLLTEVLRLCRLNNIRLLVDECFLDFCVEKGRSLVPYLDQYPNLFVLKAFTKKYAMAGLRLGYGLCGDTAFLEKMHGYVQPWNVSLPAQKAGIAALQETSYLEHTMEYLAKEREWLKKELQACGLTVYDGSADYLFFKGPAGLKESVLERKILIRDCSNYRGLVEGYYRVAIRLHDENVKLIEAMRAGANCKSNSSRQCCEQP